MLPRSGLSKAFGLVGAILTLVTIVQLGRGESWELVLILTLVFVVVAFSFEVHDLNKRLALSVAPALRFGPPHISANNIDMRDTPNGWLSTTVPARFPIVTLVNDPAPSIIDAPDAENVIVTVTLLAPDGTKVDRYTARYANSPEPITGPAHANELTEHTIAPNGREWPFNTVVKLEGEQYMRVWNNDSMRSLKDQMPYDSLLAVVGARGRGINVLETYKIVVEPLSIDKVDVA